jgi:5-methyltetrahydrofolate--homocysteine methyltransferase
MDAEKAYHERRVKEKGFAPRLEQRLDKSGAMMRYITRAENEPTPVSAFHTASRMEEDMLNEIQDALLRGKKDEVAALVDKALALEFPTSRILNEGLIAAMEKLGEMFKNNEVFLPEVLVSARAMSAGLAKLEPYLVRDNIQPKGSVVIGTVKGDLHDIGKNLVAMLLKGAGYKIIDLGVDVSAEKYVAAARENKADVVALSALLTTTMVQMKKIVEAVRSADLRSVVVIGGAPVTKEYADQIGADGYAPDAASAVEEVTRLLAR